MLVAKLNVPYNSRFCESTGEAYVTCVQAVQAKDAEHEAAAAHDVGEERGEKTDAAAEGAIHEAPSEGPQPAVQPARSQKRNVRKRESEAGLLFTALVLLPCQAQCLILDKRQRLLVHIRGVCSVHHAVIPQGLQVSR